MTCFRAKGTVRGLKNVSAASGRTCNEAVKGWIVPSSSVKISECLAISEFRYGVGGVELNLLLIFQSSRICCNHFQPISVGRFPVTT